jgi:hypothetical protein
MNWSQRLLHRPFFIRLFHWEYWSFNTVYIPIYIFWVGLCIRTRSFFFFAASNPTIKNGGFLNESKKEIFPLIPEFLQPATVFFSIPSNAEIVLNEIYKNGLSFPLIGKPDTGSRGRGVKVLTNDDDVRVYVKNAFVDFHIQEYVAYKNEIGIFYYRFPNEENGKISGIVRKEFLKVEGDGINSTMQLLQQNKRAILQIKVLEKLYGAELNNVLLNGEEKILVPYGNHSRGAMFIDDSHLIDEALTKTIDTICKQIHGFYFGRFDIRYDNWEYLKIGKKFSIIEMNGAGSEPTHIYDPKHSIFFAWKEIIRHWVILNKISRQNQKRGYKYLTVSEGIKMFKEDKVFSQKLAAMKE